MQERDLWQKLPGFFDKPFMTMLLRRKGAHSTFDDETRSAGPHQENTRQRLNMRLSTVILSWVPEKQSTSGLKRFQAM